MTRKINNPKKTVTVQALASQGGEIALDNTLLFDIACSTI